MNTSSDEVQYAQQHAQLHTLQRTATLMVCGSVRGSAHGDCRGLIGTNDWTKHPPARTVRKVCSKVEVL